MLFRVKIISVILPAVILFQFSCKKQKPLLPLITTNNVIEITHKSAKCGGAIYEEGDGSITEKGLCWSTVSASPTINDNKILCGSGSGDFEGEMSGLSPTTTYYIRAYALNSVGVSYGQTFQFITQSSSPAPIVITSAMAKVADVMAYGGGVVNTSNIATITAKGVCWSTSPNPTIENYKTIDDAAPATFTSNITGLSANTTYYLRAYASNTANTGYGAEITFKTFAGTVTDIDGNVYNTVKIGAQEWMYENLRVTKYGDGSAIPKITDDAAWGTLTSGAYCYYSDLAAQESVYGKLYNWYAVNDNRKLAPAGYHIATDNDWSTLVTFLGGDQIAGSKLKENGNHWFTGFISTNESGFTALPGGARGNNGFDGVTYMGAFWSATANTGSDSWARSMLYSSNSVARIPGENYQGLSVRCIKD